MIVLASHLRSRPMSTLDHHMATNFGVLLVEKTFVHCRNVGSALPGRVENAVTGVLFARGVIRNMLSAVHAIRQVVFCCKGLVLRFGVALGVSYLKVGWCFGSGRS